MNYLEELDITHEVCVEHCWSMNNNFAGLLNGDQCYCGDNYNELATEVEDCNNPCEGNLAQYCGGQAMMILQLIITPSADTTEDQGENII